jgi:hypothetical protein
VRAVSGRLFAGGRRLAEDDDRVEDFAVASIGTDGSEISVACSWHLHAGRDAVIEATFHGTRGGVALRNVGGSFFDFRVERHDARTTAVMAEPPDDWGGRALVDWAGRLARGTGYDPECARQVDVAEVLDRVYEAGRCAS